MRTSFPALLAVLIASTAAAPAALAGVRADGPPLKVAATLDCPDTQGALTRAARSPDGKACEYRSEAGETVRLRLLALDGRAPSEALAGTRDALHALLPVYDTPPPAIDDGMTGDRAEVDLPFLHVRAVGDRADVRLFGIKISSQGHNADVDASHGRKRSVVHAGPRGAEVLADDVGKTNASLVYVLAANHRTPSGLRAVGYVAKGPVTGPLVVAEFRDTHDRHEPHSHGHDDIDRLIDRNVRD